ncbi:ester cyclase [Schumannella luteola]|uniref:Steroid delta-isomerase-like uncharacterized protein n=1 Tax=Schumannella luteola TaxID=472059 RepID=A0A852YH92_9MICO|nr:ester cyclase [Schumannella luteola]NYG98428.1 steroid delta-isomerase-like uncharacterized protein [Schumannella luteola]TPX01337.1 ester cyclase [Schumannella luteola]
MSESRDRNLTAQERLGEILAARDAQALTEVFHDDVVDHDPAPDQAPGSAGIVGFWTEMFTAFPDLEAAPQTLVADDESVTVALTISGTHTGEFQGHAPTGRRFSVRGIQVGRFDDGRLVERWGATDEAGMQQQLGLAG